MLRHAILTNLELLYFGYVTGNPQASAKISFSGNSVYVYGATSSNHGLFSASLDGGPPVTMNGTAPQFRAQNLLVRRIPYDKMNDMNGLR